MSALPTDFSDHAAVDRWVAEVVGRHEEERLRRLRDEAEKEAGDLLRVEIAGGFATRVRFLQGSLHPKSRCPVDRSVLKTLRALERSVHAEAYRNEFNAGAIHAAPGMGVMICRRIEGRERRWLPPLDYYPDES